MSAKFLNTITADSTPVYGHFPMHLWSSNYWDQADWLQWHKLLVAAIGRDAANATFLKAWNDNWPLDAHIDFRLPVLASNAEFISYAKQNNFYDSLFSGILGTVGQAEAVIAGTTKSVLTGLGDFGEQLGTLLKYLLPVLFVGTIIFTFLYFKKHKLI